MISFTDGQTYQFQMNEYIRLLGFQIHAYEKSVELDHTGLIDFNLSAICTEMEYIKMCVNMLESDGAIIEDHWRQENERRMRKQEDKQ